MRFVKDMIKPPQLRIPTQQIGLPSYFVNQNRKIL